MAAKPPSVCRNSEGPGEHPPAPPGVWMGPLRPACVLVHRGISSPAEKAA